MQGGSDSFRSKECSPSDRHFDWEIVVLSGQRVLALQIELPEPLVIESIAINDGGDGHGCRPGLCSFGRKTVRAELVVAL